MRVAATSGGAIFSTPKGCFRLEGQSAVSLLTEVLPALYAWNGPRLPESIVFFEEALLQAGVVESEATARATGPAIPMPVSALSVPARVSAIRPTALTSRTLRLLATDGVETDTCWNPGDFAISDLSDVQDDLSCEVTGRLHRNGSPSISIWKRGNETFLGPLTTPGCTACWHCARQRLLDSLSPDVGRVDDSADLAQAVARNVILALRYPNIAGFGCLVVNGPPASLHSVLPVPWCPTCGGIAFGSLCAPINHSLLIPEALRLLSDPRAGVVRKLFVAVGGEDLPTLPISASAVVACPALFQRSAGTSLQGEGKGSNRHEAISGAIGEGVERYAASIWSSEQMTLASFETLGDRAFDPSWLVLYSSEQYARPGFAFAPADPRIPILWQPGRWLDSGVQVLVPAQATYFDFTGDSVRFAQTTSSGLAAGTSFEDAALRALYELIERDAFMLYWLARLHGERIDPDGCDEVTRKAISEVLRLGASTELYVLDVGLSCPTVICLGFGNGIAWPAATIGLGTHSDIDIAIRKAVLEHGHYGPYMRRLMREGRHRPVRTPEDVRSTVDHGLYYCHVENVGALEELRRVQATTNLSRLRTRYHSHANLETCVVGLQASGIRVAAVDLTTPDLAAAGLRVVRVFGIFAQPVHFGFGYERDSNPRLQELVRGPIQRLPHPVA